MFKHKEDMYFFIFELTLIFFSIFQLGIVFTKKEIKMSNYIENRIENIKRIKTLEKTRYNFPLENKKEIFIKNDNIKYINFNNENLNKEKNSYRKIENNKKIFLKKPLITSHEDDDADIIWYEEN